MNKTQNVTIPKTMLRRLLRLARATAESLEADKHRDQHNLIEVQLLLHCDVVEDFTAKTMRTRS